MTEHEAYLHDVAVISSRLEAPESNRTVREYRAGRSILGEVRLGVCFRHSGWQDDRKRVAEALARTDQPEHRTEAFSDCGQEAYVLRNVDDPSQYRIVGSGCRDRFCLPCATERSYVIANNVIDLIAHKEIRFLTLTIKTDSEPLTESLDKLYRSFQALRRRAIWTRNVFGGVAFLELKRSTKSHRWHPHLHCLIEGRWIEQRKLSSVWHTITGDSFVVDIRRPASNDTVARYVTKYASKPFNNSFVRQPPLLDEAILAMRGRKLCITFGRWRGKLLTATPREGTWQHVGSLERIITKAASGNIEARAIMEALTNADLTPIYERAPPWDEPDRTPKLTDRQLDWLGIWGRDGTFRTHQHPTW